MPLAVPSPSSGQRSHPLVSLHLGNVINAAFLGKPDKGVSQAAL